MNKKTIFTIFCTGILLIGSISCKKWLDLKPLDGIVRQDYWQTKEQVKSAVIGCYASLTGDVGRDRPISEFLFMWGELRGDMVDPAVGASSDDIDILNVNTLPTNNNVNWVSIYKTINFCNTVIDFAPGVLANDKTFTQQQLNNYLAEARALRALMYFYLVRSFRDVPLKLKSTSSDTDIQQINKTSADTILAQIVTDLKFADSNAVFNYGNVNENKGRITKYTVKSILADVYLWMEKYTEAEEACDFIINSGQFGLIAGNNGWFDNLYYRGNSNEGIFEFQFDQQRLNNFYQMFTTSRARFLAAPSVMEDVYGIDFLDDTKKDIRGDGAAVRTSDNAIWKYIAIDFNSIRPQDASFAHWIVYRYADILLMKAEAINQLGRGAEALAIVNRIRNRARAIVQTEKTPDPTDINAVADYILEERAREFAYEGKRWYDILRNAKRNNYQRLDVLLQIIAKAVPANIQQSAIGKYRDTNSHYFPIFFYEIQANPKLEQNPFYK